MRKYVGLDVGFKQTAVCVVDKAGCVVWQGIVDTHPQAIGKALQPGGASLKRSVWKAGLRRRGWRES